jgi:methyl-accepting chemotaxis protein
MWQGQDTFTTSDGHWLMIFAGIAAFSLLAQVLMSLGIALGALKAKGDLEKELAELKGKVMPLIAKVGPVVDDAKATIAQATGFLNEMKPKVVEITDKVTVIAGHAEEVSALVKDKLHEFSPTISAANETLMQATVTAKDVNQKTHQQVDRVNGMVSGALDVTTQWGKALQHTITQPAREVSGIVSGVKAAVTTLMAQYSKNKPKTATYRAPVGMYEAPVAAREPVVPEATAYPAEYPGPKPDLEP